MTTPEQSPTYACVGDLTIDRFRGRRTDQRIGGNALNVACWLAYLGGDAWLYTAVGDDREGRAVRDFLDRSGVNHEGVIVLPGRTPSTEVKVGVDGDRTFLSENYGTVNDYRPEDADDYLSQPFTIAHVGYTPVSQMWRRKFAPLVGVLAQDCGVSEGESELDIAFHSRGDDLGSVRAEFQAGGAHSAPVQIATCGAAGAFGWQAGREYFQPAIATQVLDTTGAGDAFMAGFLFSWAQSPNDMEAALATGAATASECCRRPGGTPLDGAIG